MKNILLDRSFISSVDIQNSYISMDSQSKLEFFSFFTIKGSLGIRYYYKGI
ncbi:hypothetical protein Lalb_Chr16g0390221 [Lupinus albus]|uniref:Uncharacterized protein n=1 Tax=Lupinus albus TaxID=3870 RepID=A0A6A4PC72_LUPAL|nr:hypothetical protein Lalb_Chr16g0390221 [Lupinus albus]